MLISCILMRGVAHHRLRPKAAAALIGSTQSQQRSWAVAEGSSSWPVAECSSSWTVTGSTTSTWPVLFFEFLGVLCSGHWELEEARH